MPKWITHKGYWRIIQLLRLVAAMPFVFGAVGVFVTEYPRYSNVVEALKFPLILLSYGVAAFWMAHLIAWIICWVKSGFTEST
jgi:hypothetical protein